MSHRHYRRRDIWVFDATTTSDDITTQSDVKSSTFRVQLTTDRRVTISAICVYNLGVKEHTTYKTQRCATTRKQYGEDNGHWSIHELDDLRSWSAFTSCGLLLLSHAGPGSCTVGLTHFLEQKVSMECWNSRGVDWGGVNAHSSCLQTLIFEWKSVLNFDHCAKFQTFRHLTSSSFRLIPTL